MRTDPFSGWFSDFIEIYPSGVCRYDAEICQFSTSLVGSSSLWNLKSYLYLNQLIQAAPSLTLPHSNQS